VIGEGGESRRGVAVIGWPAGGLEKMHLFRGLSGVRNFKFAAQPRRNNFLFKPLARYINRK
jgi:hypothetical protein